MEGLREFLAMGGYGAFIWPAFAVAIGILLAMAGQAWLARRRLQRLLGEAQSGRPPGGSTP